MALKLMFITNRVDIARIAESAGVDRIFIDMEYVGKSKRQAGLDTVQNHHTIDDIKNVSSAIVKADVLVRINPIHDKTSEYCSTEDEIAAAIEAGAQILMLPYFKSVQEVDRFLNAVAGKAKTMLLFETPEAVEKIDAILALNGIDEVLVGLNDLSIGYGKKFMFELLSDGTVETLCNNFNAKGIPYGFGGIAKLGAGMLQAEKIIMEHYRLGSTRAILSRAFCDCAQIDNIAEIENIFSTNMKLLRDYEKTMQDITEKEFEENRKEVICCVDNIVKGIRG